MLSFRRNKPARLGALIAIGVSSWMISTLSASSSALATATSSTAKIDLASATGPAEFMKSLAPRFGETSPQAISWVRGVRGLATQALSSDVLDSDRDRAVYVIEASGIFTAESGKYPAGAPAPTGTFLTLTVDASSNEITDVSISNYAPKLVLLGAVQHG